MKKIMILAVAAIALMACKKSYPAEEGCSSSERVYNEERSENYRQLLKATYTSYEYDDAEWSENDYENERDNEDGNEDELENIMTNTFSTNETNTYYTISRVGDRMITIHDMNGNYYYANVDEYGNVSAYDMNGNYYYQSTDGYGNTSGYDSNGNFYYSHTDDSGNTTGYDSNGNFYSSHTDDNGYTTGYDSNGNFYSSYTDDFGYTTVNVY